MSTADHTTDEAEEPDPLVGRTLQERYKIIRRIGEGGMGAVYEGEHITIRKRVAIKCLHANMARSKEIVARFHREAIAATQIGNEHIIECTDFGTLPEGVAFMVLEFLAGRELEEVIDTDGAMPISRAVHITAQMCDALGAAHAKGIIHRDLKPANVFLIPRGDDPDFVKILDFGISKFRDGMDGGSGMTRTGTAMGTPYFMSPEQIEGIKDIDHRVDLYAIGVILHRMLSGELPFTAESFPALAMKIVGVAPPALRTLRAEIPETLEQIVLRLLAKKRDNRFADCASLKEALQPFRQLTAAPTGMSLKSTGADLSTSTPNAQTGTGLASSVAESPALVATGANVLTTTTPASVPAQTTSTPEQPGPVQTTPVQSAASTPRQTNPLVMLGVGGGLVIVGGLILALVTGMFNRPAAVTLPAPPAPVTPVAVAPSAVTDVPSVAIRPVVTTPDVPTVAVAEFVKHPPETVDVPPVVAAPEAPKSEMWLTDSGAIDGQGSGKITMKLDRNGTSRTLSYGSYVMTCIQIDETCDGVWHGSTGRGWFSIAFAADSKSFDGTWGYTDDRTKHGTFMGLRANPTETP